MELLWDLASTIALSLLLPLIFIKVLSVTPNLDANEEVSVIASDHHDDDHDHGVKSEEVVQVVAKFDESRDKSVLDKLAVPEILHVSCGSPKIRNSGDVDGEERVYNEIEVVDLADNNSAKEVESDVVEFEISQCDENCNNNNNDYEIAEQDDDDDDDWEGIERTELERRFGEAVLFVGSKVNAEAVASLGNALKMKLYGYHRIATEGPCRQPQPMALKFSARAKWNAWQQLGNMNPEMAMERYISLLSENIPGWGIDSPYENAKSVPADIHRSSDLKA
ncbi:hypothetical protein HN51_006678 [Arachis hypogaea]|uniref:ACB domain-containing protein n=1 Tax=Arachis hypogaea TaxID=3818 RepID=A0A444WTW3_ARAHY|nr:acyl-CoA-binding domain-containing protein 3 [Arachis hypogaea]QHO40655.1 Acyl-CoA-binding domain-containing protein [Arachis hypogaea]RYQ80851.1 hypothetical protein Ahy_Scaffold1g106975 [Arachis hypogaea]